LMGLVGLEVPAEFDGRPLGQRAGADECSIEASARGVTPQPYTAAEEREIAGRLEALGYLG